MTLAEKAHGLRLHIIQRAEQPGTVSRATGRPGSRGRCFTEFKGAFDEACLSGAYR